VSGHIRYLSILHSHVFLLNSRLSHFSAAPLLGHPFFRSYRVNLPSSLTVNHSSTSGFSPRLPVSVCGTGFCKLMLAGFLGSLIRITIPLSVNAEYYHLRHSLRICLQQIYLQALTNYSVSSRIFHSCVTTSPYKRFRNINLMAIGLAFPLILRSRLTLIRLTLIRKP
jgi:hypothetical protein